MAAAHANADRRLWDYSVILEVTILRPAKDVWSHFVGKKKDIWTKSDYATIAGKTGEVGEIYTHAHRFHGLQLFYEAIKVKPEEQLVLKITSKENETDEGNLIGYDFFTLNEVAGHTTVVFQQA